MSFFSPGKIRTKIISFFVTFFFLIESVFLPIAMFTPRLASAQSIAPAYSLVQISTSGQISQKLHYVQSSNSFYGIGSDNAIWKWNNSAQQWSRITDGSIKDDFHFISESDIYAIGMDNQIWRWNGIRWNQESEGGKIQHKIWYVDGNHIYGIGMDNQVWRWGSAGGWAQITSNGKIKDDFHFVSESEIYGIGMDGQIWKWNGTSWSQHSSGGAIKQKLHFFSPTNIWGIGLDNRIWKWSGAGNWQQAYDTGQVKDDFVFDGNFAYGIGLDNQIWKWSASSTSTSTSTSTVSATSTSVNLKVNNSDGPLSLAPGATAVVSWSSQGFQVGDTCSATGAPASSSFSGFSIPASGSAGVVFASAGTYTLQIVCYRGLRTTEGPSASSASDSVIVNIGGTSQGKQTREVPGWKGRPYDLYIPPQYNSAKQWPVVLVLHGGGGSSVTAAQLTCPDGDLTNPKCLNKLAEREGFITAYPNGTVNPQNVKEGGRRWNAGGGKNGYACAGGFTCAAGIDDIGYFNALLDDLQKAASVDVNRVYATGLSNGGSMSHRLACELSNRITAIAPLAAGNQFSAVASCQPARAVPILQIHGTEDRFWPYLGGEGGISTGDSSDKGVKISIPNTVTGWASRNDASSLAETTTINPDQTDKMTIKREKYPNYKNGAEVILYTVVGGGHTWPDGWQYLPKLVVGATSKDMNANEIIWEFFKKYSIAASTLQVTPSNGKISQRLHVVSPTLMYGIGLDNKIWKWSDVAGWSQIAGSGQVKDDFTLINNSENNIYAIGLDNHIWHWNGVSWSNVTLLPGEISQRLVVVSPTLMYGIGLDNKIWKWSDTAGWSQIAGSGQVKDDFTLVNNQENNIYAIGLDNAIWHWNGVSWSRVTMIPGQISQHLHVVSPTLMYGIGLDNKIWKWSDIAGWSAIAPGGQVKNDFTLVNNSENNIYGIGLDNAIWHWNGTNWQSIGAGASQQIVQPGDYKESITVDGRERTYLLHIPAGYLVSKRYPLVAVFHGGGGTGAKMAQQTGFLEYADKEGFIAVFPDGINNNWNDGRDTTDAYKAGADDVKFIRTLVERLKGKLPIDNDRIFATGVSNGGIFSHRLACEMSDIFAAIGSDVGSIASNLVSKCSPPKSISVVVIQGTDDPFIPINGGDTKHKTLGIGDGGLVESAENAMKFWAGKNNCSNTPKKEALPVAIHDGTSVEKTTNSGCRNNAEVVYYIVNGMGHTWPPTTGKLPAALGGKTSNNIDATKTFWDFFKQRPRASGSSSTGIPPSTGRIAPTPTTTPMAVLTLQREQEKVLPDQPVSFSGTLDSSLVAFPQGTSFFIAIPEKTEVQSVVIDGRTLGAGEFSVQNGGVKIPFSQSLYDGSHSFRVVLRNAVSSIPQLDRNVAIWITVIDANNKLLLKGRTASTLVAHLPTEVIGRGFSLSVPNTITGQLPGMANCCWFSADKTHFLIREFGFGGMDITRGPFWTPNQVPLLPENIAFTLFPTDASMQAVAFSLNQFSDSLAREFITAGYQYLLGRDPSNEEMSRYLPRFIQWRNPLLSLAEVYERRADVRQAVMIPRAQHIGGDNDGSPRPSWDKLLEWAALHGWKEEASLRPYKLQTGYDDGWRRFQELWNNLGVDPYHENYRELLESNANVDPLWALAYLCEKSNQSRNHRLSSEVVDFEFCWKNDQIVRHKAILWAKDRMIFGPENPEEFTEEQALRYPPAQLYYDLLASSEYAAFLENRFRDNVDSVIRLFFGRPASADDIAWVKNKFLGGDYSFTNPNNNSFGYDNTRSWINEYWEPNGVLVASNFDYRVSEEFIKNQTFILDDVYGIRHTAGEIDAVSARLLEVIERLGRKELYEGDNFKRIVSGLYRLYLRRNPTDAEIDQHRTSGKNFGDIEMSLNQSREYGKDPASRDAIRSLYRNYLGKDPSDSEIASWSGKTISSITQGIGKSAEMKTYAQQHPENAYIFPIKQIKIVKCGFFCSVFSKILTLVPVVGTIYAFTVQMATGFNIWTGPGRLYTVMHITLNSISRGFNEAGFNGETFVQWVSIARAMAGQAGGVFSMTNLFENADPTILDGFRTMARAPQTPQSGSFAQTESESRYELASLADAFSGYFGTDRQSGQPAFAPQAKLAQIDISSHYGGGSAGGAASEQKTASARQTKPKFAKTLSRGSRGDEVLRLQKILGEIDLTFLPEYRTGYYGPKTEAAVKRFQKQSGLEQAGYVGPKTRALLNNWR